MTLSGLFTRLVVALLAVSAAGGLLTLFAGLARPENRGLVFPTIVVLGLLSGAVFALYLQGRESAGRGDTVYW